MSEGASAPIHKADPAFRRITIALALAGLVALGGLSHWFQHYLDHLPVETAGQRLASTEAVIAALDGVLYACALMLAGLAWYWWRLGRRIRTAPQYPLPQMRLFHDMRVVTGAAQQAYARRTVRTAAAAVLGAALVLGAAIGIPRYFAAQHPFLFGKAKPVFDFGSQPPPPR
jgi:hypothetical protein